jgi:hypothetical protein
MYASFGVQVPQSGSGGAAGTGDISVPGENGLTGMYGPSSVIYTAGQGGNSAFGVGGKNTVNTGGTTTGNAGTGYGAGGSGASSIAITSGANGGNGTAGIVTITEFCSS